MSSYNLGTARGRLEVDASGVESGSRKAEGAIGRMTGALGGVNKVAIAAGVGVAGGGAAIAGGFAYAVNAAADFEKRMSAVKAVSGATAPEMKQLSDLALQLGRDTSFSASESGLAIEELVKAGLKVPDVMNGAAQATVALAAAGEIDLPQAATIASNAMNQFALDAKQMPKVADLIAGAANASAIDVGDFGQSLSQVGAVAKLAGLSFEDTAIAIAEMGNAGIKGSDAGTSLKTMLSNLQPTTKAQATAMRELGLITADGTNKFYDAQGNLKSLKDIQGTLQNSTKNLTAQQKQMALETIFGSDAIRAAAVFSAEGAAGYTKMSDAMGKMTAADVAATRLDNFSGAVEQMKGSAETAAIVLGQNFLGVLRTVVEGLTAFLNGVTNNIGPAMDTIKLFLAALTGGDTASNLPWAKSIIDLGKQVKPVFDALINGFKNIYNFISGPVATIGKTLFQVFGPVIAGAVGALVLAFGKVSEVLAPVGEILVKIAGWMRENETALRAVAVAVLAGMAVWKTYSLVMGIVNGIKTAIVGFRIAMAALNVVMRANPIGIIITLLAAMAAGIIYLWNNSETFRNVVLAVWGAIQAAVAAVVNWFTGSVVPWLQSAWTSIQTGLAAVGAFFSSVWTAIQTAVSTVVNFLIALVTNYINMWVSIITTGLGIIQSIFSSIWNAISGAVSAVWNFLVGLVTRSINGWRNIISSVMNAIKGIFSNIWNGIKTVVSGVINAISGFINGPLAAIKGVVSNILGNVKDTFVKIWDAIKNAVSDKINAVKDLISNGINTIKGFFSGAGTWLIDAGKNIIQGLIDGIKNMIGNLKGLLDSVTGWIPDWKGPAERDKVLLQPNGELIMAGLIRGIQKTVPLLRKTLGTVTASIPGSVSTRTSAVALTPSPAAPAVAGGDTYNITVEVNAKDLEDIQKLINFVKNARQQTRQRIGVRANVNA